MEMENSIKFSKHEADITIDYPCGIGIVSSESKSIIYTRIFHWFMIMKILSYQSLNIVEFVFSAYHIETFILTSAWCFTTITTSTSRSFIWNWFFCVYLLSYMSYLLGSTFHHRLLRIIMKRSRFLFCNILVFILMTRMSWDSEIIRSKRRES